MARKHRISQNFLRSPRIALMLVGYSNIRKRDFTLDIGAGSGVFTFALSKKSAQVLAIEFDSETFKKLIGKKINNVKGNLTEKENDSEIKTTTTFTFTTEEKEEIKLSIEFKNKNTLGSINKDILRVFISFTALEDLF